MTADVFAVPVFFICFRECVETSIIVSVLLSFLHQTLGSERDAATRKKLVKQDSWLTSGGKSGAGMIGAFYGYGKDHFASTEDLWEGIFSLLASVIITIMGAALLRVNKLREKWRVKLAQSLETKELPAGKWTAKFKHLVQKYFMFILPFITVLREGLEAVVFVGGVSLSFPASAFPLPVITGLLAGIAVGYMIYRGGNQTSLQIFLIISTCILYLVSAGLFSRGVWYLENNTWNHVIGGDAAETGAGPGSYDIRQSWTNSATYGSVISYNLYWLVVIVWFVMMGHREKKGYWPVIGTLFHPKARPQQDLETVMGSGGHQVMENNIAPATVITKVSEDEATRLQATEVH
ncbi:hypothetical protein FE257_012736 [Aspergillus nanangensis]|uniref:Uncharacterized protein n=1 Tax=Aspergillus nanangensis TaxID=2582783 RepID=A0AAD4CFS1_ASPNN|nr:hypothetical protein FE257_012736 [Aspergillus nanangensis]